MSGLGLVILLVGAFAIYEAVRAVSAAHRVSAASAASGPSSAGNPPATVAAFTGGGGLLPASWYNAVLANESTLPPPGSGTPEPAFGLSGAGPAGSRAFPSQAPPYTTPPLQLFNTMEEAVGAFDSLLRSGRYAGCIGQIPSGCLAYFTCIGNAGYASPSDMAGGWPRQVCSRVP
jgi:hypothetical protein